ncbi:hypothetical protein H0H93_009845 [Arthromyces matolae]|nr:hypothetical protein H0H93_009845 [Arthromyces matolae]
MSSKRGRKRNDNLPPNRARDVQRAFRARRAAHLLALEQRVAELHEENATLREMVGWPPDDRPSLGKGPTGKDNPKLGARTYGSQAIDFFNNGSESDSPSRTSSLSPSAPPGSSHGLHVIDSEIWENALTMEEFHDPPEPVFQHLPVESPPAKTAYVPRESRPSTSIPSSSSRSTISLPTNNAYMTSRPYAHSVEGRLEGSCGSPSFVERSAQIHADPPRETFSYHAAPYQTDNLPSENPPRPSTGSQPNPSFFQRDSQTHAANTPPEKSLSSAGSQPHTAFSHPHPSLFNHRNAVTGQYSNNAHTVHPTVPAQTQAARSFDQLQLHGGTTEQYSYHLNEQQQTHQQHTYQIGPYGPDGRISTVR